MVDGHPLGPKDREGIAKGGGLFEVALREGDVLARGQLDLKGTGSPSDGNVTLALEDVTLPGGRAVLFLIGNGHDSGEGPVADGHGPRVAPLAPVSQVGPGVLLEHDAVPDGEGLARGEADLGTELPGFSTPLSGS